MQKLSHGIFLLLSLLCCINRTSSEVTVDVMNKLSEKLLRGYNKNSLPASNFSQQYEINVTAVTFTLGDLDELEEKLTSVIYFQYWWHDVSMHWDPADHGGLTNITINYDDVWKPILVLANPHEGYSRFGTCHQTQQSVFYQSDGTAYTFCLVTMQTSCDLDTTFFPFDIQRCNILLYLAKDAYFNIKVNAAMIDFFSVTDENAAWYLLSEEVNGTEKSTLNIELKLKRKPQHVLINLLLPICMLALLSPLVFLMPHASGERLGYSVTMLLAISVYMTIITEYLPDHADPMPLVTIMIFIWYLLNSTIVVVVIVNTKVRNIKDKQTVPFVLRKFVVLTRKITRRKKLFSGYEEAEESETFLDVAGNSVEDEKKGRADENDGIVKRSDSLKGLKSDRRFPDGVSWAEVSVAIDKWAVAVYYFLKLIVPTIFMIIMKCQSYNSVK